VTAIGADPPTGALALADLGRPHAEGGPRCSTGSVMHGESLAATASLGRRWLLVEVAGGWGWSAFLDSPALPRDTGRAIVRRAEAAGLRIAAIRKPGRARGAGRWRYAVVDTGPGSERVVWGEADSPDELVDVPLDGGAGTVSTEPLIAVCAHGRHDECCAVRGRRVAADLVERFPEQTWECSHIGGDRFAATMLLFPHGLNFGRVDHADAPAIVDAYLAGRIAPGHYRGRTAFGREVQAAQEAARTVLGDDRVDAYPPLSSGPAAGGRTRVELAAGSERVLVEVEETSTVPLFTTCAATRRVPNRGYRAVSVALRPA